MFGRKSEWRGDGESPGEARPRSDGASGMKLLDADDTLRGILVKSVYRMDIRDEVLREVLGGEDAVLRPGDVVGLMGSLGSGKSTLAMHILAVSILPESLGGHDQQAFYIDSESSFSIEVFIEKHLIPLIELRLPRGGLGLPRGLSDGSEPSTPGARSERNRADSEINRVICRSLRNLNVAFTSDLLDLLCVLRRITTMNHVLRSERAKLLVIDSLTFWNASDLSSFCSVGSGNEISNIHHVLGYLSNKSTLFNSAFSLIKQIIQFHGFIGVVTICEEPILSLEKFRSNFSEELVELPNLFQHSELPSVQETLDLDAASGQEEEEANAVFKFPKINHSRLFPAFIQNKVLGLDDFKFISNLIWIARSSLPVNEQIHRFPDSPSIPSYFSCLSLKSLRRTFLAFDNYHGLILV
ncbi:AAA domain-containing protein [Cryptosporidium felis]|nr:AAA domain-containing protein [Cryptosporidium felis]